MRQQVKQKHEGSQSRSTAFPRHQKKKGWGTNNGQTITKTRLFIYIENFTKNSFQIKILIFFYISAQNVDCGIRLNRLAEAVLTSTHNLFWSRNKKTNVYPCKPQFYYIKVGFTGVKIISVCFCDVNGTFTVTVCVEVLRPSQPNGVLSSVVS